MLTKTEVNQEIYERSIFIDQVSWLPTWRFMIIFNQILIIASIWRFIIFIDIDIVSWLLIWIFVIIINQILIIAYMEIHDFYRQSFMIAYMEIHDFYWQSFMIAYMEIHDLKQPVSHDAYLVNIYDFINQDLIVIPALLGDSTRDQIRSSEKWIWFKWNITYLWFSWEPNVVKISHSKNISS